MRVSVDQKADAVYLYMTEEKIGSSEEGVIVNVSV